LAFEDVIGYGLALCGDELPEFLRRREIDVLRSDIQEFNLLWSKQSKFLKVEHTSMFISMFLTSRNRA